MLVRTPARPPARSGATMVEAAMVTGIAMLLLLGLMQGAIVVSRYQQVAHAAREGSRWAAVHGAQYGKELKVPPATQDDVFQKAVVPNAPGLDPATLKCTVTWDKDNRPYATAVNASNQVVAVTNTVTVSVAFTWNAGLFGTITVSSVSVSPMFY